MQLHIPSFTFTPIISMSGILHDKMLILFQESTGKFGPRMTQSLLQPPNLNIKCSISGKMSKIDCTVFVQEVLSERTPINEEALVILDQGDLSQTMRLYRELYWMVNVESSKIYQ